MNTQKKKFNFNTISKNAINYWAEKFLGQHTDGAASIKYILFLVNQNIQKTREQILRPKKAATDRNTKKVHKIILDVNRDS